MPDLARRLAVARGDAPADLVIEGARVFCAFTRAWLDVDVGVVDGVVSGFAPRGGAEVVDGRGRFLVPGFIDAHVHVESSKLMVGEFARTIVARGTTTVVVDPHEIANVLGVRGVRWLLDACDGLPVEVLAMAPSCVPASPLESPRAPLGAADIDELLTHPRVIGIGEMMDFPAVVAGAERQLETLALGALRVDGHAPGLDGAALDAYLAAGIDTDHEAFELSEALAKRRRGAYVLIREASNARNLAALLPLVQRYGPERCAFCTDDREPQTLVGEGHVDAMCRAAVAAGLPAEETLLLATLHPALAHGLRRRGAIAPGWAADLQLLDDLAAFRPSLVWKAGRVVARDGEAVAVTPVPLPAWVRGSVDPGPFEAAALALPHGGGDVRVIGIVPEQLVTEARTLAPTVADGAVVADPGRDLAKIAVVERHHASGRVGVGLVQGFGLTSGAFASTVAHDAHNLACVGVDDADMTACVHRLAQIGGGLVVYDGGALVGELPLPVAGLMSDAPAAEVAAAADALEAALAARGVAIPTPFMTLSFLTLSVIPELKITDRGLVDVARSALVPLAV
jgi:adenine deaminase